ncbi:MAG: hypothetical protein MJE68_28565 [Proteobacteria bacterium]|nr:hypothetical protein [Pseudomonadota bacterium]
MISTIAKDTESDTDKSFQKYDNYDNLDEDQISLPPTYKTATRLHTNLHCQVNKDNVDETLQELPAYDEIDDNEAVSSLPTYETASKLTTDSLNTKGTLDSS